MISAPHLPTNAIFSESESSCKFIQVNTLMKAIEIDRIGRDLRRMDRRPRVSTTEIAMNVPRVLTKLRGKDRMMAALSSPMSYVSKPAYSIRYGP